MNFNFGDFEHDEFGNKIPTVEQNFNDNKQKIKWLLIGSSIGILFVLLFEIFNIVWSSVSYNYNSQIYSAVGQDYKPVFIQNMVFNTLILLICAYWIFLFSKSVVTSYKKKNFMYLHPVIMWFYLVITIIACINLMTTLFRFNKETIIDNKYNLTVFIINIVECVVYLLFYIFFIRNLSKIRKSFIRSTAMEDFKKQMSKLSAFSGNDFFKGIFGEEFTQNEEENEDNTKTTTDVVDELKTQEIYQKLAALSNEKLFEVASRMSIFGYDQMDRDELIHRIIQIDKETKARKNMNNKTDDIEEVKK